MKVKRMLLGTSAAIGPMTAAERAKGRYMRAPDDHPAGGGGGGGAADLLEDPKPDDKPGGGGDDQQQQQQQQQQEPGKLQPWASGVSATKGENETASNADWMIAKGFKDIDGFVKSARDTERAFLDRGAVKIPGDDAKPEEIAAFRKAIGVPEKAEDYAVDLPAVGEGEDKLELDTAFLDPMKAAALKAGISGTAFKELGSAFVQHQLESMASAAKAQDTERDDLFKEWGANKATKLAEFRQGAKLLGLGRNEIAAWQSSAGSKFVMTKLAELGGKVSEDLLANADGPGRYGVATQEDAQKQIDEMSSDKDVQAKLKTKDPATVARWNRLNDAVAAFRQSAASK